MSDWLNQTVSLWWIVGAASILFLIFAALIAADFGKYYRTIPWKPREGYPICPSNDVDPCGYADVGTTYIHPGYDCLKFLEPFAREFKAETKFHCPCGRWWGRRDDHPELWTCIGFYRA